MRLTAVHTPEQISIVLEFALPYEHTCTKLVSIIRKKAENLFAITDEKNRILGLVNVESTLYFCIPHPELLDAAEFADALKQVLKKSVHCVSGESCAAEFLILVVRLINQHDKKSDDEQSEPCVKKYSLLHLTSPVVKNKEELCNDDYVMRCTERDMDALFPLQKGYVKEEVANPRQNVSDAEVSIMLRGILKNQLCLAIFSDRNAVAKANSNAIGMHYVQIGGVYTLPLYRRNGYAAFLLAELCGRIQKAGKTPVLFVNIKNTPAENLYKKLGFTECGGYEIAYF